MSCTTRTFPRFGGGASGGLTKPPRFNENVIGIFTFVGEPGRKGHFRKVLMAELSSSDGRCFEQCLRNPLCRLRGYAIGKHRFPAYGVIERSTDSQASPRKSHIPPRHRYP